MSPLDYWRHRSKGILITGLNHAGDVMKSAREDTASHGGKSQGIKYKRLTTRQEAKREDCEWWWSWMKRRMKQRAHLEKSSNWPNFPSKTSLASNWPYTTNYCQFATYCTIRSWYHYNSNNHNIHQAHLMYFSHRPFQWLCVFLLLWTFKLHKILCQCQMLGECWLFCQCLVQPWVWSQVIV